MPKWFKKVDKKKMHEVYKLWLAGKLPMTKASKMVGLSMPTTLLRFQAIYDGEENPEWYFDEDK